MLLKIKSILFKLLFLISNINASVSFLPNVDFSVDLGYFFLHKNENFNERFMFESEWNSWIKLISVGENFSFTFNPVVVSGLSRSQIGLVFHPSDISYGLISYGEYRTPYLKILSGLDHSCFHEVDIKIRPTIYWNKVFAGIESHNNNERDFVSIFTDSIKPDPLERLSWSFFWSWYVREFFGVIEPVKIMTNNIVNHHDFVLDAKYAVFHRKNIILSIKSSILLGIGNDKSFYWRQIMGGESSFRSNKIISTIYLTHYFDGNWFDSRDKLLEMGVRFAK